MENKQESARRDKSHTRTGDRTDESIFRYPIEITLSDWLIGDRYRCDLQLEW